MGLSELHLGNASRAANIFRRIVKNHKNYYSAIYLLGATYLCLANFKDGEKTLQCLHGKTIWKDIHHAFQNLIESLISAGCLDLARNLIEGTELLNCCSENIIALRRRIEMEAA